VRRQDQWLLLADRLERPRVLVVAVCAFLNLKRSAPWIAKSLGVSAIDVQLIEAAARPLLRQSRRADRGERVCSYCGSEDDLTRDHVMPRSRGGLNDESNKVWACRSCNSAKGNRTPEEWLG
jgi:5-methylcytosine-specific restriction endonuclease McrA